MRAVKLLFPLVATSLLLAACTTSSTSRPLWASRYSADYSNDGTVHREVWAPRQPFGRSDINVTRRDLYSPTPGAGPYTASLYNGAWKRNGQTADQEAAARQEQQRIDEMQTKPVATPES